MKLSDRTLIFLVFFCFTGIQFFNWENSIRNLLFSAFGLGLWAFIVVLFMKELFEENFFK
ncbi:MAG: hypothetical protein ACOC1X_03790 [Promethearchaeota archaeon]